MIMPKNYTLQNASNLGWLFYKDYYPRLPTARTNAGVIGEPLQPADYFWGDRLFLIVRTFEQARQQTQSFGAVYQFFRHRQCSGVPPVP